jgi:hypothetical protein
MQRYLGVAIAALLILGACTSTFAKDHPDVCSDAKIQQVKDAIASGSDLAAAAAKASSDPQCLTNDEQKQAQASYAAYLAQSPTPAATTAAPATAAPTATAAATSAAPSPTDTPAATTAAPTPGNTVAPTDAPTAQPTAKPTATVAPTPTPAPTATPVPTTGGGVPGGVPNATGPVPPGFTRYGGTVLDSSTNAPIKGVCVYSGPPAGCPQQGTPRTDANGYFAIDYPAGVTFLWTFEHPSYKGLLSQPIVGGTNPTFHLVHN